VVSGSRGTSKDRGGRCSEPLELVAPAAEPLDAGAGPPVVPRDCGARVASELAARRDDFDGVAAATAAAAAAAAAADVDDDDDEDFSTKHTDVRCDTIYARRQTEFLLLSFCPYNHGGSQEHIPRDVDEDFSSFFQEPSLKTIDAIRTRDTASKMATNFTRRCSQHFPPGGLPVVVGGAEFEDAGSADDALERQGVLGDGRLDGPDETLATDDAVSTRQRLHRRLRRHADCALYTRRRPHTHTASRFTFPT